MLLYNKILLIYKVQIFSTEVRFAHLLFLVVSIHLLAVDAHHRSDRCSPASPLKPV